MTSQLPLWRNRVTSDDVLAVFTPDDVLLSRAEIARRLGVSRTRRVIALIESLVDEGHLVRSEELLINRTVVFLYRKA